MVAEIDAFNAAQAPEVRALCEALMTELEQGLPGAERKVWHRAPVWFVDGNPVAGYFPRKEGVALLFWSGQSFEAPGLAPEGKFKAAEVRYRRVAEIDRAAVQRWLAEARVRQWDYKNLVRRKGRLEKLGAW